MWLVALVLGCPRAPEVETPVPEPLPPRLPADARAWYLKARVAEARGQPEAADRALAWVLRLDPSDPWAWVHVGDHYLARGAWAESRAHAEEALERAPGLPEAWRILGLAAVGAAQPDALEALDRAGELPGVVGARVRLLGDAAPLRGSGPAPSADEALDRAGAALDVGAPEVAYALARPILDHPVRGPEALALLVRTCSLDEIRAWALARPELGHDPPWQPPLLALARETGDTGLAERVLERLAARGGAPPPSGTTRLCPEG